MAPLTRFDTPGRLRDLPESSPFYASWHQKVSDLINRLVESALSETSELEPAPPNSGFYNASQTEVRELGSRGMLWMGFPRELLNVEKSVAFGSGGRREAFRKSDTRGGPSVPGGTTTQVEYLEWFTERDPRGRITKVTFTTETPEYWQTLFEAPGGPERVLELYRELLGNPAITLSEITDSAGRYDPLNVWNTARGIIHFIVERGGQVNTFDGAMKLATHAAVRPVITDNFRMALGSTSADPRITVDVRGLTRKGLQITTADPIGLYLAGWDDTGWSKPDGSPVDNYWQVVRPAGAAGPPALRLVYEVPASEGFVVGDVRIGGRPIEFGGQIAEHLTVMLTALAGTLP
jgi:hypothetical protein